MMVCYIVAMPPPKKVVVLASGGLDSAALLGWALRRYSYVQPLYCRFGLRWERAEQHWLNKYLRAIRCAALLPAVTLDVSVKSLYKGHWSVTGEKVPGYRSADPSVYLPGRNALLLSYAAVYAARHQFSEILLGTLSANPFPDATPFFLKAMARALTLGLGKPIRITAPFRRMTKNAVLRVSHGLPLHLTFSCLNPKGFRPCHACNKCAEFDRVFRLGLSTSAAAG